MGCHLRRHELRAGHLEQAMNTSTRADLDRSGLPGTAQAYVATVIAIGATGLALWFPVSFPLPALFWVLLVAACVTSTWKVNLPIPILNGSTLSVSYAANLTALLLLGPRPALLIAVVGVWTQCTFHAKHRYPVYRTVFSVCAESVTMIAS